jgi:predicted 3-demethylubiquinone-9 3-methyltransferase (glyoxalase superfamily)
MTDKINIAPCLWFNKNAEEAAKFYAATFPPVFGHERGGFTGAL